MVIVEGQKQAELESNFLIVSKTFPFVGICDCCIIPLDANCNYYP